MVSLETAETQTSLVIMIRLVSVFTVCMSHLVPFSPCNFIIMADSQCWLCIPAGHLMILLTMWSVNYLSMNYSRTNVKYS